MGLITSLIMGGIAGWLTGLLQGVAAEMERRVGSIAASCAVCAQYSVD